MLSARMALFSPHGTVCVFMYFMLIQCETVRWGFAKSRSPCASRPHEGGRAASEVDHHARLLAGERGQNEPEGLFEGTFKRVAIFSNPVTHSNPSILIQWCRQRRAVGWLAGAAENARARWRRRRSARHLPRGAGRASRGARAGHGDDSYAEQTLPAVVVTVSAASIAVHADAPNYRQASFDEPAQEGAR